MQAPRVAGFAAVVAVLASPTAMAIEEPGYRVIEQDGSFELREYSPYLVAETRVEAGFTEAGNIAFRRLFAYISGANTAQAKIQMTAPVTQSGGEKIAMTAPVSQVPDQGGYRVAFMVPSQYTRETVPTPTDPAVKIREVPARLAACLRYSGRWTEERYLEHEQELHQLIKARGLVENGAPILARYNPPFMPWFLRRNEVLIPVERRSKR